MVELWVFAVLFAAGLGALVRRSGVGRGAGSRLRGAEPGTFELFWSRKDGRLLAVAWLALFAAAWLAPIAVGLGGDSYQRGAESHPIRLALLLGVQIAAALLLVPLTAGLYVYRRAIPQIARDEEDERERLVQGDVYRRTHLAIIVGLAVLGTLLTLAPDLGRDVLSVSFGLGGLMWANLLLPSWVLLFMLPSVIYAWMNPRREDAEEGPAGRSRLDRWLGRALPR